MSEATGSRLYTGMHYVYTHIVAGKVVYVGKGYGGRAFDCMPSHRPAAWHEMVEKAGWFDVEIVAWFKTPEEAFGREKALIREMRPILNIANAGYPSAGKGKKLTAEHRAKISAGNMGRVNSPATRAKLSASLTGRVYSDAERTANLLGQRRRRAREGFFGYEEYAQCSS